MNNLTQFLCVLCGHVFAFPRSNVDSIDESTILCRFILQDGHSFPKWLHHFINPPVQQVGSSFLTWVSAYYCLYYNSFRIESHVPTGLIYISVAVNEGELLFVCLLVSAHLWKNVYSSHIPSF